MTVTLRNSRKKENLTLHGPELLGEYLGANRNDAVEEQVVEIYDQLLLSAKQQQQTIEEVGHD